MEGKMRVKCSNGGGGGYRGPWYFKSEKIMEERTSKSGYT